MGTKRTLPEGLAGRWFLRAVLVQPVALDELVVVVSEAIGAVLDRIAQVREPVVFDETAAVDAREVGLELAHEGALLVIVELPPGPGEGQLRVATIRQATERRIDDLSLLNNVG